MAQRIPVFLLILFLVASPRAVGRAAEESKPPKDDYYELYKLLVDTVDQVERNYVKDVDRRKLIEGAIRGVLKKLDPYSSYISPEDLGRFQAGVAGEFGGIGIRISINGGKLKIISPLVGTPAYRAGLLAGDHIVEIEGESTEDITLSEAVRRLKGKEGTTVKLTVVHTGQTKKHKVEITREIIHVETVLGHKRKDDDAWDFMLDHDRQIGYVRVTAFSRDTAGRIKEVLKQLRGENLRGLILDLRFNPGGLLSSAIEVSDMFVSQGRIVSTKGRNTAERTWDARKDGTFEGFPMVVLVNRYSASASEIVSACLQDHKRAVIVGERTWGKGSVQNVIELEGGRSALKLTTASYRRPNGKNIHRFGDSNDADEWGVMPDEGFEVKLGDGELVGLMQDRQKRDILRGHASGEAEQKPPEGEPADTEDQQSESGNEPRGESEEPAFIDRQLRMAVEYLSGELARAE